MARINEDTPIEPSRPSPEQEARSRSKATGAKNTTKPSQRLTNGVKHGEEKRTELVTGHSKKQKGIRWAPLRIPIRRRLETLAVVFFALAGLAALAMFWFTAANPLIWPLYVNQESHPLWHKWMLVLRSIYYTSLIPYLIHLSIHSPPSDEPPSNFLTPWVRNQRFWSYFTSYFPMKLHRSVELSPDENYLFGFHPHGIISHGAWGNIVTKTTGWDELFPGITNTLLTLESNFRLPFYREYLIGMGLGSVSRKSCEGLLGGVPGEISEAEVHKTIWDRAPKVFRRSDAAAAATVTPPTTNGEKPANKSGRAITIVVGGAQESLFAKPGTLTLKMRKGFLRVAVRTGAHLVPILSFGENDIFDQLIPEKTSIIHKGQALIKRFFGFTIPLFHARGIFNYDVGLVPYRTPVNTVVGRPIKTVQSPEPRDDYIDELQDLYCEELQRLWEEHKEQFAPDRRAEMQIIR